MAAPVRLAARLVTAGLILPLLPALALAQGADQAGQPAPSAQELLGRLQQIQGEVGAPPAGGDESRTPQGEPAQAPQLSEEQVQSRIEDELGVQVLGLEVIDPNGPPAYAVRVMNPPGNYSAAFLVSTLLVDGDTGEVLGEMRTQPSSADPDLLPESRRPDLDASGREIRRRSQ